MQMSYTRPSGTEGKPNHHKNLDESTSSLRGFWWSFFIVFCLEVPVNKECRPCSDAPFCGVLNGSALLAHVSKTGFQSREG